MANTTIKITQLPNIGNNLSANTLLPVVDTSGVAITEKVTVGNVANYILSQAGNTLPTAFVAELAYDVVNANQPNITSLGDLVELHVLGNANIDGNLHIGGSTISEGGISTPMLDIDKGTITKDEPIRNTNGWVIRRF